jgi:uncharacterized protein (TIGR01777 family)
MRITLSGAMGFLGQHLMRRLLEQGHTIALLARRPVTGLASHVESYLWDPPRIGPPEAALAGADALIHLAGATVNQRWTPQVKALLRSSRLDSTRSLVQGLSTLPERPRVFLSSSAIGFYGARGDEVLTEGSPAGKGFLADLSVEWENEALLARALGIRVNLLRTGVVLGREGGALASMLPAFRLGLGGKLGSGRQWMSWIHIEDWVEATLSLLDEKASGGAVNLTAPEPVRNEEFTATLGRVLRRPAIFPVPEAALKLVFGEMSTVLLASQRVAPEALTKAGYRFRYPMLESALRHLLQ